VTGERLQALAEVTLLPRMLARRGRGPRVGSTEVIEFETHRDLGADHIRRLSRARSMFVYTDALALFQEHVWPRLTGTGYVLVTHSSDHEIGEGHLAWIDEAGAKLSHWFAQNLSMAHPKLSPLPIGLANHRWPHGDTALLCQVAAKAPPRTELVHAAFDLDSHPDRRRAWQAIRAAFPDVASSPRTGCEFGDYLRDLSRHRFCACPRGNGIDTHRFWECQYLGVIPVVERSPHTDIWAGEGCQMVTLEDWSALSRERLESAASSRPPASAPWLRLSHHSERLCMFGRSQA
jgi:hypothetical protein